MSDELHREGLEIDERIVAQGALVRSENRRRLGAPITSGTSMTSSTRVLLRTMEARELDALIDRLVAEYADRVACGRASELDDLVAQVPPERRVDLRRLLALVDVGEGAGGAPIHAPKPLGPGVELGDCRILGELGRGGMATVYRAEQKALKREVALKVLRPGLALDPKQAQRFRREALAAARLDHPNVVRVHDVGAQDGHLFLVMEKVDGGNLAHALSELPPAARRDGKSFRHAIGLQDGEAVADGGGTASFEIEVARFFAVVARAVAAAHARGIVHRDLKPSNILLRRDGSPVVADFGLAKGEGDLGFTLTGEPLGTPYYMSPEQVEQAQARVDARTDVWSLGVTLYETLAGRRPFEGPTTIAVFDAIRRELPPSLRASNPKLSHAAEAVVAKAMERDPARRYASAEELAADLEALAAGRPVAASLMRTILREWHLARGRNWRVAVGAGYFGRPFEYRSTKRLFGLPLLHINVGGYRAGIGARTAKGIVAIGDVAIGVIAVGGIAFGGLAMGGMALGAIAFAGLAAGLLALGGIAAGIVAFGGCAFGAAAIGGLAVGWFALGGKAIGHAIADGHGANAAMVDFYEQHLRPALEVHGASLRRLLDRAIRR